VCGSGSSHGDGGVDESDMERVDGAREQLLRIGKVLFSRCARWKRGWVAWIQAREGGEEQHRSGRLWLRGGGEEEEKEEEEEWQMEGNTKRIEARRRQDSATALCLARKAFILLK
jgi:hypothetical protein